MNKNGPLHSPAARPSCPAAKVDPSPRRMAAQINLESQTAQFTDDGSSNWGIVKYNEGKRVGWVRTGLTFADAKNIALEHNSNTNDLGIEYRVERELDPEPAVVFGPQIDAYTPEQHKLLAKYYIELWGTLKGKPEAQALLEKFIEHQKAFEDALGEECQQITTPDEREKATKQIVADLRAQVENLQGALEMKCQDETDALAALNAANAQITELQARPDDPALTAHPHDNLTLAYLRKWYAGLSQKDRDAQPLLIHDLVVPWHKRSIVWTQIVRAAGKVGLTPYEASPPKKVTKGQGAIQPKSIA